MGERPSLMEEQGLRIYFLFLNKCIGWKSVRRLLVGVVFHSAPFGATTSLLNSDMEFLSDCF